jgi:hypothetical protein
MALYAALSKSILECYKLYRNEYLKEWERNKASQIPRSETKYLDFQNPKN